jgi:hypothetical protein
MGVGSLVLGILSIIISFFGVGFQWVGAILGLIGIILGAVGRKDPEKKGVATGGLVCSIIGFILCILIYVGCAACVGGIASMS